VVVVLASLVVVVVVVAESVVGAAEAGVGAGLLVEIRTPPGLEAGGVR
jgi:hypothetical protein